MRLEVKKAKKEAQHFLDELRSTMEQYDYMVALWGEFDSDLLRIEHVELNTSKIAGVRLPYIQEITFSEKEYR